jgi:phosphoribosylanthranilate isomerase
VEHHAGALPPLRLKVCGVEREQDLRMLDRLGVDYAGIHVLRASHAHADPAKLLRATTAHVLPVLVTLESSLEALEYLVATLAPRAVQLQGCDLPSCAQRLKRRYADRLRILKVLHLDRGRCLEAGLVPRYRAAGVDIFVVDTFRDSSSGDGACRIDLGAAQQLMRTAAAPCLIAGAVRVEDVPSIRARGMAFGIDVQSFVKRAGALDPVACRRLVAACRVGTRDA